MAKKRPVNNLNPGTPVTVCDEGSSRYLRRGSVEGRQASAYSVKLEDGETMVFNRSQLAVRRKR